MSDLGECLVSHVDLAQRDAIIDARTKGKSWADIAKDQGLASPEAARRKFTQLTGSKDYKSKGDAIKALKNGNSGIDKAIKAVDNSLSSDFELPKLVKPKMDETPQWKPRMTAEEAEEYVKGTKIPGPRYHGTNSNDAADAIVNYGFDDSKLGSATGNYGQFGSGHYFTSDVNYARTYAGSGSLVETRLLVRNPMPQSEFLQMVKDEALTFTKEGSLRTTELIKSRGYDGLRFVPNPKYPDFDEIVVFDQSQIVTVRIERQM
jgi:hypothetical protein